MKIKVTIEFEIPNMAPEWAQQVVFDNVTDYLRKSHYADALRIYPHNEDAALVHNNWVTILDKGSNLVEIYETTRY